jgi:hypothetical protein
MKSLQTFDEMLYLQMLSVRFWSFPDAALWASVIAAIRNHVNQLISFDSIESPDWSLIPSVDAPL